jgi:hypothetical protein
MYPALAALEAMSFKALFFHLKEDVRATLFSSTGKNVKKINRILQASLLEIGGISHQSLQQ